MTQTKEKEVTLTAQTQFEAELTALQAKIAEREYEDELNHRVSLYAPFVSAVLFTVSILVVKLLVY